MIAQFWHAEFQHKQRHDDRKHAIAEGFDTSEAQFPTLKSAQKLHNHSPQNSRNYTRALYADASVETICCVILSGMMTQPLLKLTTLLCVLFAVMLFGARAWGYTLSPNAMMAYVS